MSKTLCFSLPGITCVMCVAPIVAALTKCQKKLHIKTFQVDHDEKTLNIVMDDTAFSPDEVFKLVRKELDEIGVSCVVKPTFVGVKDGRDSSFKKRFRTHWLLGLIGTGTGLTFLTLSLVLGALPVAAMMTMALISVPLTLLLGAQSYKDAATKLLKSGTLTMDTLFVISTLTLMIVSISAFFFPWLPMMFDAGLLIFGFRHLGLAIEESIKHSIGIRASFKDRLPKHVDRVSGAHQGKTRLGDVTPGDVLRINPGDVLPVDGFSLVDDGSIYETIMNGSTLPRRVLFNEPLFAGMYLATHSAPLCMRVSAVGSQSYLSTLDDHISRANGEKAPLETATNRILQYFIPTVLIFSLLSLALISYFFSFPLAIGCAVSVLVSACPCTLGFITPLAVKIGMKKAAEHGVQFKSAKHLQEAEHIDTVVFDLHGTLTKGIPRVSACGVAPELQLSKHELLSYFYALEMKSGSSHPMAKAICDHVTDEFNRLGKAPLTDPSITIDMTNHSGLTGFMQGEEYVLGNQQMMNDQGVDMQQIEKKSPSIDVGDSLIYLARAKKVIGYVVLTDPLRDDALRTVNALKSMNKRIYLCTGADEATALRYAKKLGISPANTYAACVGADTSPLLRNKKSYIQQLRKGGHRVCMIGDAANDAVAVAASDFGIAIKSKGGDDITQQEAGAVIQSGSLLPLVGAFAVAKQTVNNIKQNLVASVIYNALTMMITGGLLLAVGVVLNPGVGVALMMFQTSLILLNAYRFKQQKCVYLQDKSPIEPEPSTSSHQRLSASMPTPKMGVKSGLKKETRFHASLAAKARPFGSQPMGIQKETPFPIPNRIEPEGAMDSEGCIFCS